MKRICFLVSYNGLSNAGGVERVCLYLDYIFKNEGFEVRIIDKNAIEEYWVGKIIMFLFGKVHLLVASIVASLYVCQYKRRSDIVVTNGFNCPFVFSDILFMHGTMKGHNLAIGVKNTVKANLPIFFERCAIRLAKNIVSVSNMAVKEIRKYYGHLKNNCFVVNNMVDENIYFPILENQDGILRIIFCGRIEERKGKDKLIELAKYLDEHNINARLIIATNNETNTNELRSFKSVTIKVGLTHNQLNEFYNSGNVMYFPSKYEGFEMVTLESLSSGIPVLGNHVGAVAELFDRNEPGVDLIKEPDNPLIILGQLQNLAKNFSSSTQRNVLHEFYSKNYGINAYVNRLKQVIKDM